MFFLVILAIVIIAIYTFFQQPQFGKTVSGHDLKKIEQSPNYKNGQFQNNNPTPQLTDGASMVEVIRDFFFRKSKRSKPSVSLPSKKVDLFKLNENDDVLVWFGHSSYFIQVDGKKILVDPVFSGHASPVSFTTKSFQGSDVYSTQDIPEIDYLVLSHDHYDHLDYETIKQLRPKTKTVITALGVSSHLQYWGYDRNKIIELDWNGQIVLENNFIVNTTPARHFSGRGFKRNNSLWLSFVLSTPTMRIFLGGDSGYDDHFGKIGEQFGPFDLVILENGQYNKHWKFIHMMPEEAVQAAIDLKAKKLLPVHWGKFSLSLHSWDEPIIRLTAEAKKKGVQVVHPMIGEPFYLKENSASIEWWRRID